jgi:small subunit ribosomal protein S16
VGATKRPSYRVVAIDSRRPRDGRALEILGFYDPLTRPATVQIDAERFAAWVGKGAMPSDTVAKLIKINGSSPSATPPPAESSAPKPKRSRKAVTKAAKAEAAPAAEAAGPEPETAEAAPTTDAAPATADAAGPEPETAEAAPTIADAASPEPETAEATE